MTQVTPRMLDLAVRGVPVWIYRNANREFYASLHDFSGFGTQPITTIRVPLKGLKTKDDALNHKTVKDKLDWLAEHS